RKRFEPRPKPGCAGRRSEQKEREHGRPVVVSIQSTRGEGGGGYQERESPKCGERPSGGAEDGEECQGEGPGQDGAQVLRPPERGRHPREGMGRVQNRRGWGWCQVPVEAGPHSPS